MATLINKADDAGRYIEDGTFRTVALVVACIGFFLIALVGVRGEDTRSESLATKNDVSALSSTVEKNFEESRATRHELIARVRGLSDNISDLQNLLRENGITPGG